MYSNVQNWMVKLTGKSLSDIFFRLGLKKIPMEIPFSSCFSQNVKISHPLQRKCVVYDGDAHPEYCYVVSFF